MTILEEVEQQDRVHAEHRRDRNRETGEVSFHDVGATLRVRREPEPAHACLATRVHEDERYERRTEENLEDCADLEPRHGGARVATARRSKGTLHWVADDVRERVQKLLVTGDNRLKQGVAPEKVRASYEEALAAAREAGLEDTIGPLVELRLADLERREEGSPPPVPPAA